MDLTFENYVINSKFINSISELVVLRIYKEKCINIKYIDWFLLNLMIKMIYVYV